MISFAVHRQIDQIVRNVRGLAESRDGRLVRLTVAFPGDMPRMAVAEELCAALKRAGFGPLELVTLPGEGAIRVLSAEFER